MAKDSKTWEIISVDTVHTHTSRKNRRTKPISSGCRRRRGKGSQIRGLRSPIFSRVKGRSPQKYGLLEMSRTARLKACTQRKETDPISSSPNQLSLFFPSSAG
jgi:hypothetical protein